METTIFMNGQSQAVRIPKDYRLNGGVCDIIKKGGKLIITEKKKESWEQFFDKYQGSPEFEIERNHTSGREIPL
ncbi:MAG: AbrB/MazE/SpoVT family DNA-binding domain-containing protein [Holosporaceae bacterium]|nr:AbrB/MazE/SpoVT family DNA-binding domain-containing protein [Holosporaceae bacterium]